MKQSHLAARIKELRTRKGMSQELLAEESGISHRTVQRIENGESNPTGDTLQRLAIALNVNPDELIDWTIKEDNGYVVFLNLSAISFLFFPILGILVPFIMWTSKKDKLLNVNKVGIALINFEITWTIMLVLLPVLLFFSTQIGLFDSFGFFTVLIAIGVMYFLNFVFIVINTIRISNRSEVYYFSFIKFLR